MFSLRQVGAPLLAAAIWAAAPGAIAAEAGIDRNVIRSDPAVRRGVLPNGLRYAVKRTAAPAGGVTLRLAVDAGSLLEHDDELGLAHFVEHMAFNGTRSFPEDRLDVIFAARGVAFGRDQNAATSETQTLYRVDLKSAAAADLDLGFRWLRDVADGMLFAPEAVARERGVVLAEREARSSPQAELDETLTAFRGVGLRAASRRPIGTVASIEGVTPARLRDFHARWYRPDNAAVVAVGDAPVEELERRIVQAFGDWRASGPPSARPAPGAPVARGLEFIAVGDSRLSPEVAVCRVRRPDARGPDDLARLRRTARSLIWRRILQQRLAELPMRAEAPVLAAGVWTDTTDEAQATCMVSAPVGGAWTPALAALQAELRRLEKSPPSETEVADALAELRSVGRGAIAEAPTRTAAVVADELADALLSGDVVATPQEAMRVLNIAIEDVTPAEVKAAFDADWSGAGPLVSVISADAPASDVVEAAWARGVAAPATASAVEPVVTTWRYALAETPGRVVRREVISDPGFTRIRFANGVILNFRQTAFAGGEIRLRATFGAGLAEIADRDRSAALLGAELAPLGGLGRNSFMEIERMMRHHEWGIDLDIEEDTFVLEGRAMASSLDGELAILSAYLTDPGFRPTLEGQAAGAIDAIYKHVETDPEAALDEALDAAMSAGRPNRLPPRESLRALKAQDFARLLKPALTQAPIVLTVVGDVDEAAVIAAVGRTFGVMASRAATARLRADATHLRYAEIPPPLVRVAHRGSADKAAVSVVWPLYVDDPTRRRETYAVMVAGWVLEDQLRLRVRERLGKTYAPQARAELPEYGDQGALRATVETRPADVAQVLDEIRRTAAELAAGGVTADMVETVRRPVLKDMEGERLTNDWWLDVLSQSGRDPARAERRLDVRAVLASITVEEVRKAAADWLSRPSAAGVSIPIAQQMASAQGGAK